jgi:SAM-dependent methyltransferase
MNIGYEKMKNFKAIYAAEGAYHKDPEGYKAWFLEDNYRAIADECSSNHTVIDLACGEGCLGEHLKVSELMGVDYSQEALDLNSKLYPGVYSKLILSDLRELSKLDLKLGSVDRAVCSLSLMYLIAEDLEACLRDTHVLLKDDGAFVFTYPTVSEFRKANPTAVELETAILEGLLKSAGFRIQYMKPFCPLIPKEAFDQSADSKTEKQAKEIYDQNKTKMTLENSYHFVCYASKH